MMCASSPVISAIMSGKGHMGLSKCFMADTHEFVHTNLEQAAGKQKKYDRGLKHFQRLFCLEMVSSNC